MGWLRATPEFDNVKSRSSDTPTRWETIYGNVAFSLSTLKLPILSGEYLLIALEEMRPFQNNGFGIQRQTWTEIANYGKIVGYLNNNELRILYELSGEWVAGYKQGLIPLSKSPLELLENDND